MLVALYDESVVSMKARAGVSRRLHVRQSARLPGEFPASNPDLL
jgi:hypothetical protein